RPAPQRAHRRRSRDRDMERISFRRCAGRSGARRAAMSRFVLRTILLALLASCSTSAYGAVVELAATGQFEVQGSEVHRSLEFPLAFLVSPSPFGRPVFITTGPLMARLLAPARITRDAADREVVRVDTSGPQEDFLSVRAEGENLTVSRNG